MRRLLPAILAATNLVSTAPAFAQDATSTTAFDWNGFYAGVFAGGSAGEFDADADDDVTITTVTSTAALSGGVFDYGDFSIDDESWLAGGTIGFNRQNGRVVFGAVGDIMGTNLEGSTGVEEEEPGDDYYADIHVSADWLATLRGLLGITSPDGRFLFYLTGGLAFTEIEAAVRSYYAPGEQVRNQCGVDLFCDEDSDTVVGIALGAGVGAHLTPKLVLDLSYLYANFSDAEFEFGDTSQTVNEDNITGDADIDFSAHLGRIGLTYYFGGGLPPP